MLCSVRKLETPSALQAEVDWFDSNTEYSPATISTVESMPDKRVIEVRFLGGGCDCCVLACTPLCECGGEGSIPSSHHVVLVRVPNEKNEVERRVDRDEARLSLSPLPGPIRIW